MEYEPGLLWLTGMEVINHHTLSDFRIEHGAALTDLFTQMLVVLSDAGLVNLRLVAHDGVDSFRREATLREELEQARRLVEEDPQAEGRRQQAPAGCAKAGQEGVCRRTALDPVFGPEDVHMLSIGTGEPQYYAKPGPTDYGLLWWGPRLLDVAGGTQSQGAHFQAEYLIMAPRPPSTITRNSDKPYSRPLGRPTIRSKKLSSSSYRRGMKRLDITHNPETDEPLGPLFAGAPFAKMTQF